APRLRVRAIEHAGRFFNCSGKSESARNECDIVVDRLRHADNRERVSAFARFLIKIVRAALGAIASDGEENVDAAGNKIFHRPPDVDWPARGAENRAAFLMNAIYK